MEFVHCQFSQELNLTTKQVVRPLSPWKKDVVFAISVHKGWSYVLCVSNTDMSLNKSYVQR